MLNSMERLQSVLPKCSPNVALQSFSVQQEICVSLLSLKCTSLVEWLEGGTRLQNYCNLFLFQFFVLATYIAPNLFELSALALFYLFCLAQWLVCVTFYMFSAGYIFYVFTPLLLHVYCLRCIRYLVPWCICTRKVASGKAAFESSLKPRKKGCNYNVTIFYMFEMVALLLRSFLM